MNTRFTGCAGVAVMAGAWLFAGAAAAAEAPSIKVEVRDVAPVSTAPLRLLAAGAPKATGRAREARDHRLPIPGAFMKATAQEDPVVQMRMPEARVATVDGVNFNGIGQFDFGYTVQAAPPDTTGAVGTTQFVQWVNTAFAIFDKSTGALQLGPFDGNLLFNAFGPTHPCGGTNNGDPLVLFDRRAQRWVLSQFAIEDPFVQCVAVSQTDDATGAYWLYAFVQPELNDFGKLGIWADAYYISYNMFDGVTFDYLGPRVCAMKRAAMLVGNFAREVCFQLDSGEGSLLPADIDGSRMPPVGTDQYFVSMKFNALGVWRFHVDFTTPANSTLVGPTILPVAAFTPACGLGGTCIKQPGTTQLLDSLGDRLMYRLAYRRRGNIESLVVNHAVKHNISVAPRWYELRTTSPGGPLSVFQQSTFHPDAPNYRWMGSMATDKQGNIAMGYSVANKSLHPSIRYTGRLRTDPKNKMQAENTIITGTGSQSGSNLSRWGDYSTMTVDPVDDCTFWYTQEYMDLTGSFNWKTRIASFKFPGCS